MPTTERSEQKRQRVHQLAMELFIQHGFEGVSMDTIAAQAGVSKPTLYRYYPNKEALFIAVIRDMALSAGSEANQPDLQQWDVRSAADLEDALTRWAEATVARVTQPAYLGLIRLLVAEIPRFPDLGPMFYAAVPQQGAVILITLLRRAEQQGIIVLDDTEAVIRLIAGGMLTYTLGGLFGTGISPPTRDQIRALMRVIVQSLIAKD